MEYISGASPIVEIDSDTCVIIVGGVHGNEPAGVRALENVRAQVTSGTWTITSSVYGLIGNPAAVEKNVRFIDENLNRAFGRSTHGSHEDVRAKEIAQWLQSVKKRFAKVYMLDLHSVSVGETRIAIVMSEERIAFAEAVSPIPFKIIAPPSVIPGTLLGYAETLHMIGLVVECGNHSSPHGETVAMEHIERLLRHCGALSGAPAQYSGAVKYEGTPRTYTLTEPIQPCEGFMWSIPVSSELLLTAGTEYARDPAGSRCAPYDCYVIMPSKVPQPEDYDAGFIARRA